MPEYDFHCDPCDETVAVRRPMREAGDPAPCPRCGAAMARRYDLNVPVIFRPVGYSRKPADPDYWDGFDDPLPPVRAWARGANAKKAGSKPDRVYGAGNTGRG